MSANTTGLVSPPKKGLGISLADHGISGKDKPYPESGACLDSRVYFAGNDFYNLCKYIYATCLDATIRHV
jgi:hypothetical protein